MIKQQRLVRVIGVGGIGGIATVTGILAQCIDREQYHLTVVYLRRGGEIAERLREMGYQVIELNLRSREILTVGVFQLVKIFKDLQPDIVHSSSATASLCSALAGKIANVPKIIGEEVCIPERRLRARLKYKVSHTLSDHVIAVSHATKRYLIEKEYCSPSKVVVLHNSYSLQFDEVPLTHRETTRDRPVELITISRLAPEKNLSLLLQAIKQLEKEQPGRVRLTIVGDGIERRSLEQFVREKDLTHVVRFLGQRDDIVKLLMGADIFLLPSLTESFGISLVEAMRCGVLFLASDVGGISEVTAGYPQEYLLSPYSVNDWKNGILNVIGLSDSERMQLRQKAMALAAARFSPTSYMDRLEKIYTS